jgi:hypothetical protein
MSWESKKAILRIFNLFKRTKDKVYSDDIDALKLINEIIEEKAKSNSKDNLLYAKLLCVLIGLNVEYYKDITMAIKKSNDVLKKPLDYHLEMLTMSLNNVEKENYFKSLGFNFDSYDEQKELITKHQKEIIDKLNKSWDVKTVENSFFNSANSFLKDVNNYS